MLKLLPYMAVFFLLGCESNPKRTLLEYSETASVFLGEQFEVQSVNSNGAIADSQFIAQSKDTDASDEEILLAENLDSTSGTPYKVAIVGDNYSKNAVVVLSALNEMSEGSGTGSAMVCFCSAKYRPSIESTAQRVGVNIYYVVK